MATREIKVPSVASADGTRIGCEVGVRVRVLLGTETAAPLVRSTRAAHAAVPGSSVRGLPGHGHAAMDAAPDLFVAEVSEWLSP